MLALFDAKFWSLLASGVSQGAIVALVALGFLVIFKATGIVNFAQGDLVTLGAYFALWLSRVEGWPLRLAYAVAIRDPVRRRHRARAALYARCGADRSTSS